MECMLLCTEVLLVTAVELALDSLVKATKKYLHIKDYVISKGPYDEEIVFATIWIDKMQLQYVKKYE